MLVLAGGLLAAGPTRRVGAALAAGWMLLAILAFHGPHLGRHAVSDGAVSNAFVTIALGAVAIFVSEAEARAPGATLHWPRRIAVAAFGMALIVVGGIHRGFRADVA